MECALKLLQDICASYHFLLANLGNNSIKLTTATSIAQAIYPFHNCFRIPNIIANATLLSRPLHSRAFHYEPSAINFNFPTIDWNVN